MATRIAMVLLLWLGVLPALPAHAQDGADQATLEVLAEAIRANRKALVAVNLQLDDAQAATFWPAYERYQQELAGVNLALVDVIQQYTTGYGTMTDEQAEALLTRFLAVERERIALRERFLPTFAGILPGRALARLYQIENKMDAVVRYELARDIPVLEQ